MLQIRSFLLAQKVKVKFSQSCLTLCDPLDCSLPGSSVHGILQARILEWVAIPFFRGSSQPRDRTQAFCIADRFFIVLATREALLQRGNPLLNIYQYVITQHVFKIKPESKLEYKKACDWLLLLRF